MVDQMDFSVDISEAQAFMEIIIMDSGLQELSSEIRIGLTMDDP